VPIYDRPVRLIMREMADVLLAEGKQSFSREDALNWFATHYPRIKEATVSAHLARLSTNNRTRLHYHARPDDDDQFFQLGSGVFRRYNAENDPAPIRPGSVSGVAAAPDAPGGVFPEPNSPSLAASSEFAYEHDLRDYLARNLHLVEPGLRLYEEEGVTGIEFPVGGRFIDILAVDTAGDYVVVELKVSKGYDRVVGQLLRYVGWIETHHADPGQSVRGVIVAKEVSEDLRLACRRISGVHLFEYELSVTLTPIATGFGAPGV
jgi:endonuclease NucS-like protein